jgi:hypothetical protein
MPDRRIQYVQSNDVDREKWDHCIASAPNSLIYNTSIYLDMMADHWNAVIVGDYEAVMPLPWRRKWFIRYHYHVPFIAQNGLTGNFSPETSKQVAKVALKKIGYGDLLLNYGNEAMAKHIRAMPLINLVLDLSVELPHIFKLYHHDLDKNLKRASRYQLVYGEEKNVKLPIELFKKTYASRLPSVREVDYERFMGLCLHFRKTGHAFVRKVTDGKGRLFAVALFLRDEHRLYNLMNTVTAEGRRRSANHFLFDQLIREFAGQKVVLDFEGSQKAGIRKFYENFGARNEPYYWSRRRGWV